MDISGAVDAALRDMSSLLGSGPPPTPPTINPMSDPPAPPVWEGVAARRASLVSGQLDEQRRALYSAHHAAAQTIAQASLISTNGRTSMAAVLAEWANDKAAVAPMIDTAEGQAWLAAAGQQRLSEADGVIRQAVSQYGEASQQMRAITVGLPLSGGGVPQSPTDDPYPPGAPNADKINDLYKDLAKLEVKIAAHNAVRPLPGDTEGWAEYNEQYEELMSELLQLQAQFAIYGIELIITPPDQGESR